MKILLDTTFLLPAVGISIKDFPQDALTMLDEEGCQIAISEITLFELSAKGAKFVSKGAISLEQLMEGIRGILHDETVEKIPAYSAEILSMAVKLRCMLTDFVDCLILSTALNHCDALVTEDMEILSLKKNKEYLELLLATNPNFKLQKLSEARQT